MAMSLISLIHMEMPTRGRSGEKDVQGAGGREEGTGDGEEEGGVERSEYRSGREERVGGEGREEVKERMWERRWKGGRMIKWNTRDDGRRKGGGRSGGNM